MSQPIEVEFLGYFPIPAGNRPTARQVRGDVSLAASRASAAFPAWDGVQEVLMPECLCVCGGRIVAETKAERDILAAVQVHNALPRHVGWREREGA